MKKSYSVLLTFFLCFSFTFSQVTTTIQDAIDAALEGDAVTIPAGTYAESLTIDKSITLSASEGVILDVSGFTTGISIDIDVTDVTIDGFTIIGDNLTGSGITVSPGTENITITNNNTLQTVLV